MWFVFLTHSPTSEYYLEDAIEMLHFIPPPQDKKKKKPQGEREAFEVEPDVSILSIYIKIILLSMTLLTILDVFGVWLIEPYMWNSGHHYNT